jgi:hypothetical protein
MIQASIKTRRRRRTDWLPTSPAGQVFAMIVDTGAITAASED